MELKLINEQGQEASVSRLPTHFWPRIQRALVHQVLVAYQANARSGNRAQKDRQDVRHTTKKPWRQKGTGRARAGMSSSPIWRGGGRVFPSSPDENFSQKLNRKMYRAGMASILSQLVREDRLAVVDSLSIEAPKTRCLPQRSREWAYESVLVITDSLDENVFLAARNLPNVLVVEVSQADPVSLVRFPKVLLTKGALAKFEEILG
jgi:large subunit ribosomal protein L4